MRILIPSNGYFLIGQKFCPIGVGTPPLRSKPAESLKPIPFLSNKQEKRQPQYHHFSSLTARDSHLILMATFLSSRSAAAAAMARSAIQHRLSPLSFSGSRLRVSSFHRSSPPTSSLHLGFSQVRAICMCNRWLNWEIDAFATLLPQMDELWMIHNLYLMHFTSGLEW